MAQGRKADQSNCHCSMREGSRDGSLSLDVVLAFASEECACVDNDFAIKISKALLGRKHRRAVKLLTGKLEQLSCSDEDSFSRSPQRLALYYCLRSISFVQMGMLIEGQADGSLAIEAAPQSPLVRAIVSACAVPLQKALTPKLGMHCPWRCILC